MTNRTTPNSAPATPDPITERSQGEAAERVAQLAAGGLEKIELRLAELERELEAARAAEASVVVVLTGPAAGATPVVCCPAAGRTLAEVHEERCALKALRGDFRDVPALTTPEERAEVARFEGEGGRAPDLEDHDPLDQRDRAAIAEALQAARR